MSRKAITLNLRATGSILPQSFVKGDTANALACLQAGAGSVPIGISGNWTRYAGGTPADDGNEVVDTEFPEVNGIGCVVPLVCGTTGTWTPFVFLKPDAAGLGTPASGTDVAGAFSLEAANPGEAGRVLVIPPGGQGVGTTVTGVTTAALSATLTTSQSGQTIVVTGADKTITLPTGVAGLRYKVMTGNATAATGGSVGTIVHVPTGDTLNGQLVVGTAITPASGKGAVNTDATAVIGDFIEVLCTAANTWFVTDVVGVWAREA